jgi:hypothetical protein
MLFSWSVFEREGMVRVLVVIIFMSRVSDVVPKEAPKSEVALYAAC